MVAVAKTSRLARPRVTQFYPQGVNMGEAAASATCLWMQSECECDATMWQWERALDVMRQEDRDRAEEESTIVRGTRSVEVFAGSRTLPLVPEEAELPPVNEQEDDEDTTGPTSTNTTREHILEPPWRRVRDTAEEMLHRRVDQGYYSLSE